MNLRHQRNAVNVIKTYVITIKFIDYWYAMIVNVMAQKAKRLHL